MSMSHYRWAYIPTGSYSGVNDHATFPLIDAFVLNATTSTTDTSDRNTTFPLVRHNTTDTA